MMAFRSSRSVAALAGGAMLLTLAACGLDVEQDYPEPPIDSSQPYRYKDDPPESTLFGEGGFNLLGVFESERETGGPGIGVNAFLWRASLDTVSFMPLSSADPFGGVIITDWYSPPETPDDRFKMNIYILGRQLRADGLRVSVFRQTRGDKGAWVDSAVQPKTATDLENQILTRARQLRVARASSG